jgi:hypothetical protein
VTQTRKLYHKKFEIQNPFSQTMIEHCQEKVIRNQALKKKNHGLELDIVRRNSDAI